MYFTVLLVMSTLYAKYSCDDNSYNNTYNCSAINFNNENGGIDDFMSYLQSLKRKPVNNRIMSMLKKQVWTPEVVVPKYYEYLTSKLPEKQSTKISRKSFTKCRQSKCLKDANKMQISIDQALKLLDKGKLVGTIDTNNDDIEWLKLKVPKKEVSSETP